MSWWVRWNQKQTVPYQGMNINFANSFFGLYWYKKMVYGLKVRLDWIVFGKMEIENAMLPLWDKGFVTFIVVSSSIMICMYASKSQTKWPPRNLKYGNLFRRRQEFDQYFFVLVYFVLHDLIMSSLFGRLNANGRLYSIALKFPFIGRSPLKYMQARKIKDIMLVGKIHRIVRYRDCWDNLKFNTKSEN